MGVMTLIETSLGAFFLGICLNTYLYGIVTYQYSSYFNTKFGDPLWIKGTVLALFTLDTFHTSSLLYLAWYYLIKSYENPLALLVPMWPYPFSIFVTTSTAFLTHMFLAYRVLRLTNIYVYGTLLILSLASFGSGLACGVRTWISVKGPTDMGIINPLLATWLSAEVIVDASISGTLIYALSKARTGFNNSDTIISRLMRTSIQTGLFSGIFSVLTLALYLGSPDAEFFALFGLPISRLYTNTLMDTLLCRESLRGLLSRNELTSGTYTNRSIQMSIQKEIRTDVKFDQPPSPLSRSH
ncbi:hypothetical protein BDZ97DRAFT_566010 [Flammula alnicola]|nr:hypothetical protein BDZ97DRAFT_566010 [Flammula alnicola]